MKKVTLVSLSFLSLVAAQVALVACDNPKQRPSEITKEIQSKIVKISDLRDVTSETTKAYFYRNDPVAEIQKIDKVTLIKIDESVMNVLSMIKKEDTKAALELQLSSGLVSFVVLPDQIKIYKVLTKAQLLKEKKSNLAVSLVQLIQLKKLSFENSKLSTISLDPKDSKSEIEFLEIAAVKIERAGVLENDKTKYYEEKMSTLNVAERPFDLSTHLLLKEELSSTEQQPSAL